MNCNCNNINNTDGSGLTAYISHVYGNVLRLAIPLTLRTVTMENGEMVATDTDFIPSSDYPVTVVFSKGGVKISLEATMQNGNIAYIEDLGTIPVGKYDIAILCKDDNGNPYRFKQVTALHIVDATADANIPSDIEYEVTTWYLDAAIFLALKGEDGVGIDDIITESSGEIGGMNTVTIVLTNGETRTFTVMNGSGQVDSDFNINSPHPLSNSTITAKFNAIDSSIDGLFGGADYDSQSKTIRFYNKDRSRVLATIDARPFIKDGMVNSVYISNNTLVITFNTDAGREAIGVSLSSIFNPNNYYTKTQVNNLLGNYYDKEAVNNFINNKADVLNDGRIPAIEATPVVLDYIYAPPSGSPIIPINPQAGEVIYFANEHKIRRYYNKNSGQSGGIPAIVYVEETPSKNVVYYNKDDEKFYLYNVGSLSMVEIETGSGSGGYEPPVGGIPKSDLASDVQTSLGKADTALQSQEQADWNESDSSDPAYIKNKPTIPDVSGFVTASDVADAVADLVDSAPATLDTLNELAAALGDDPNFATTMATALGNKVDKVSGKGLSTEDYTTAEKTKLEGLSNYDDTALQAAVAGKVDKETGKSLMTDAERTKLQGVAAGAEVNVQPNWTQTNTSSDDYIKNKPTLATVATSGSYNDLSNKPTLFSGNYNDLTNKPTIPSAQVNADWNATSGVMEILNKPTIPTVDSSITQNSTNAAQSGAVYTALQDKLSTGDVSIETPSTPDGTFTVNVGSDTYTVNLNHTHENMCKVVMCEENDLPSTLATDTIYVQVDDDESPTEIEKLYICGLEFSAGEPDTTSRLISPAESTELDFNGSSTLEVVVRGAYLAQALTITATGDFTVTANNSSVSSISASDANTGVTLTLTKGSNFVGGTLAISSTEVSRTVTVKSPLPEGFTANKAWNDTTLIDATGYCISPVLPISQNHTYEIKFGFVRGETQYGCAAGFQSGLTNGSAQINVWASTDPRQKEITYGYVCGTFKISEIDDCYIKDVTSNTYVWKGKNVT